MSCEIHNILKFYKIPFASTTLKFFKDLLFYDGSDELPKTGKIIIVHNIFIKRLLKHI